MYTESSGLGGATKRHFYLHGCFFAVILVFFALVIYRQTFLPPGSPATTILQHIHIADRIGEGIAERHDKWPHKGFFHALILFNRLSGFSFRFSGFVLLSACCALTALLIYRVLLWRLPSCSRPLLLGATLILMTASAIYVPFFNRAVYFGQGSPTMWHNATMIALKPVALVAFYMTVALINRSPDSSASGRLLVIALLNLLTAYIKPTFLIAFVPAVAIWLLPRLRRPSRIVPQIMIVLAPALLLMFYQHAAFYGSTRKIGFSLFSVWSHFTPSIPVSVLLALAFPLAIALVTWPKLLKNDFLRVAWIMTLVGMAQFAFLAEFRPNGTVFRSANFIGGYLMGLSVLFLFSMEEYIRWLHHAKASGPTRKGMVALAAILIALHTFSGGYYLGELLVNRKTTAIRYSTLRKLSVEDVEKEDEAVIESRKLLRSLFGGEEPRDRFTPQENLENLEPLGFGHLCGSYPVAIRLGLSVFDHEIAPPSPSRLELSLASEVSHFNIDIEGQPFLARVNYRSPRIRATEALSRLTVPRTRTGTAPPRVRTP